MIVMANRDICLSHSTRDKFGKYELGMIERVLASDLYRKGVVPDEKRCSYCKYSELCMEYGMVRPLEDIWDIHFNAPYCRRVLDSIAG